MRVVQDIYEDIVTDDVRIRTKLFLIYNGDG